jgi:uncharacterized protein (TIGR02145 family)
MNQRTSNTKLRRSKKSFKNISFLVFSLITTLIAINTCEKPERVILLTTFEALPADISFTTATLKGEIIDLGSAPVKDLGILISENSPPLVSNSRVESLEPPYSKGSFQVNAENLNINTTYYFRTFANVSNENIYANSIKLFKTKECNLATVITSNIMSVTSSSAFTGGDVTDDGGATVTARGVCWSTSFNPVIAQNKTIDGSGTGKFSSTISGLTDKTTYHVRAYATNAAGTAYGADSSFTTLGVPVVITSEVLNITASSASSGGVVTADGGDSVAARGVCWGITVNPTTDNTHTTDGSGLGEFISIITDLDPGTLYHLRAYATNSIGTAYGADQFFTTKGLPVVTTTEITEITATTAESGGNITSNGGTPVTVSGVCWSTFPNPSIDDEHTTDGSVLGLYTSNIIGLASGTTYHVRAYATNSVGTAYGSDIPFATWGIPTITTSSISLITATSAKSGGNITSNGGTPVNVSGVCWSTFANPTIEDEHTTDGSLLGLFTSDIIGLTFGTTYHVRAYATNSVGTAYGADSLFTTLSIPEITTLEVFSITTQTAKSGGIITYDGGDAIIAKGICWNTSGSPEISDYKTINGLGSANFESDLTELTPNTNYFVRAYATNSVGTAYGNEVSFITDFDCGASLLDRRDNKSYWTVKIGTQCWFAVNLNIGTMINSSTPQTNNDIIEKYCYDNNESDCDIYGGLYQWDELMQYSTVENSKGICPDNWHIPSDNDWKILEMYLGMSQTSADSGGWRGTTEGGKLKAKGTYFWDEPNEGATNSSQFTALPSGDLTSDGVFEGKGYFTDFWTSTFLLGDQCIYRYLDADRSQIYRTDGFRYYATPIRCLRDKKEN